MDQTAHRFRKFDTSLVSDALDEHGIDGVVTGLDPIHPDDYAVGRATTLRLAPAEGEGATNFPAATFDAMAAGRMLVMDSLKGVSCWGGNASKLGHAAGLAGVVTDGDVRDADDIRAGDLPIFSDGTTPRTGQRRVEITATNDPIGVGGVTVNPDDVVVADVTGVVVVPGAEADAVADTAEELLANEREIEDLIAEGATHEDLREFDF